MHILVLAVTKRERGYCIAGTTDNKWIRPIKQSILRENDILDDEGNRLKMQTIYDFELSKSQKYGMQTENYYFENRPKKVQSLSDEEFKEILNNLEETNLLYGEDDIIKVMKKHEKSLILVHAKISEIEISFDNDIHARMALEIRDKVLLNQKGRTIPCTDLHMLQICKNIINDMDVNQITLNSSEIEDIFGERDIYVSLGLTAEKFRDEYWAMIIGVHFIPSYIVEEQVIVKIGDPFKKEVIDEYVQVKKKLVELKKKEEGFKTMFKQYMHENKIDKKCTDDVDFYCKTAIRVSYPKDMVEEFVAQDILDKIKQEKEITYLRINIKDGK